MIAVRYVQNNITEVDIVLEHTTYMSQFTFADIAQAAVRAVGDADLPGEDAPSAPGFAAIHQGQDRRSAIVLTVALRTTPAHALAALAEAGYESSLLESIRGLLYDLNGSTR